MAATRRLAAIMFTDIAGYTAAVQTNESAALELLNEQEHLLRPLFAAHQGREIKSTGDGFLVEFDSALKATQCALDIQQRVHERNARVGRVPLPIRIGIHLGDVEERGTDILGDAVNIAARIESVAEPGGICLSGAVREQVWNKIPDQLEKLPAKKLKGLQVAVDIYGVLPAGTIRKPSSSGSEPTRLAVLPFVNISPDPSDEFFADGLTEEMVARLSLLKGLEVIARTSVMTYKGRGKSASQIGKELGAGTLLEGSVRKAGNRIRVTVQLIDSTTEGHLWAKSYDENLENIFAVQSEIAEKVASALKLQLLEEDKEKIQKRGTSSLEAYTLLLKGKFSLHGYEEASFREAIRCFEAAIALDPGYAAAYAELSTAHGNLGFLGIGDRQEEYRKADAYARKALELDEFLPEAHLAIAFSFEHNYDLAGSRREIERALELDPSSTAGHWDLARYFMFKTQWDDCLREVETMLELDPYSAHTADLAGVCYDAARKYDQAVLHFQDALELDPKNTHAVMCLGLVHIWQGRVEEGLKELKTAVELSGETVEESAMGLACAYVKLGEPGEARGLLERLLRRAEEGHADSLQIGAIYGMLGEKERALDWLERAYEEHVGYLVAITSDRLFESLYDEPRFHALVKKLDLL